MSEDKRLYLAGIMGESIVDGPGIRFAIFCQGCPHYCPGCHNPETHPFEGGTPVKTDKLLEAIDKDKILKGVTFSGGEPICQAEGFLELAKGVKERGLDIVIFTGYTYECLMDYAEGKSIDDYDMPQPAKDKLKEQTPETIRDLLNLTDILIDGPYIEAERDLTLQFRGSRNQRVIDLNNL